MPPAPQPAPLVLLVGHCRPDASYLTMAVRKALPAAAVRNVLSPAELDAALAGHGDAGPALALVNRVLEPGFDTDSGLELIRELRKSKPDLKLMLISNYADAQAQAVAAGAYPGFGKNDLTSARVAEVLHAALK